MVVAVEERCHGLCAEADVDSSAVAAVDDDVSAATSGADQAKDQRSTSYNESEMADLLEQVTLSRQDDTTCSASSLRNRVVLIYFSASWCPPCRRFTPLLK